MVTDSLRQVELADSLHRVHVADSLHNIYVTDSINAAQLALQHRVFGQESTLSEQVYQLPKVSTVGIDRLVSDPIYIYMLFLFALLYLVWLPHIVKGGSVKWSLLKRMYRKDSDDNREVVGHQRLGMQATTWLLGLFMTSMLTVRFLAQFFDIQSNVASVVWIFGGVMVVLALLFYGWSVLRLAGYLTLQKDFVDKLFDMKRQLYVFIVIFVSPMLIISGMSNFAQGEWVLQLSMYVVFVFGVIFVQQSFLLFMRQNISILHWILYLCAVEILPLTFLWGLASRAITL